MSRLVSLDTDIDSAILARARRRALVEGKGPRVSDFLMNPYRFGDQGPADPDYASVSCLLHFDGANGSTSVIDSGPLAHTFTTAGTAALSTTQAKWGPSSFNSGNGNARTSASMASFQFGSGAFTCEAWIYPTATPTTALVIAGYWRTGALSWYFGLDNNRKVVLYWSTNGTSGTFPVSSAAVTLNTWTHVAAVRSSNTLYLFVNGGTPTTSVMSGTLASPASTPLSVGADSSAGNGAQQFVGYIEDLRITKGVARYTSSFSVPTSAFPNH